MKKLVKSLSAVFLLITASSALALGLHLVGDSTMSVKDPKDYPETGWGEPFAYFFNDEVQVRNHAMNGRSTRTFIEEGRWQALLDGLKADDVVIIQFGHNDEVESKVDRYTAPEQYKNNLRRFIRDVREKKAQPILMTSIVRRYFNENGKLRATHPYTKLVREIADEDPDLVFIDMERITHDHFEAMGDRDAALRFMHIRPDLHPNYPNGVRDDTHLNSLGAREVAQLVLKELKKINHPLGGKLRPVDPKHLKLSY